MEYSNSLLLNGSGEAGILSPWVLTGNGGVSSGGYSGIGKLFLAATSSLAQTLTNVQFVLEPRDIRIAGYYKFTDASDLGNRTKVFILVKLRYFNEEDDFFYLPINSSSTSNWEHLQEYLPLREDQVFLGVDITLRADELSGEIWFSDLEVCRSITPLEQHEVNNNPHQLPLAITVNQQGIKATKGEETMFWLKDNGDAIFAGELQAATGVFNGTVTINGETNFAEGYDPSEKLDSEGVGDMAFADAVEYSMLGETLIQGGYLQTVLINADRIQAGTIDAARIRIGASSNFDSGYDPSTKETPAGSQAKVNALSSSLGSLAWDSMVGLAKLDSTIIQGGYIKTSLIEVNDLKVRRIWDSDGEASLIIDHGGNTPVVNLKNSSGITVAGFQGQSSGGATGAAFGGSGGAPTMWLWSDYLGVPGVNFSGATNIYCNGTRLLKEGEGGGTVTAVFG